jgi:ArsR family transcriptional regulator
MVTAAKSTTDVTTADTVKLLKLLADSTRLGIIRILADGARSVGQLCDLLKLPQPTVSHHLGLLRLTGILINVRRGKSVLYQFGPGTRAAKGSIVFDGGVTILCR